MISRVINSSRKVRLQEFEAYVVEAYILRTETFSFWPMNDTIHRMWGHCIYKMQKLGGRSFGLISENSIERMVCICSTI